MDELNNGNTFEGQGGTATNDNISISSSGWPIPSVSSYDNNNAYNNADSNLADGSSNYNQSFDNASRYNQANDNASTYNYGTDNSSYAGHSYSDEQSGYGTYHDVSTKDYMNQMAEKSSYQQSVNYYQQSNGSYGAAYQNNTNTASVSKQTKVKKEKTKKKSGFGKFARKAAILVASAAIFGLVSGGIFRIVSADTIKELKNANSIQQTTEHIDATLQTVDSDDSTETPVSPIVSYSATGMDVSGIVENAMPSVVSVYIKSIVEYNQGFFGSYEYESEGSGSGIILSRTKNEIYIVTNNHVVEGAESVQVGFIDGSTYDATVKSLDPSSDLAIIVVSTDDISDDTLNAIKVATIGNSDNLKVGEQVVAIGNALGYGQSVTTGIVSAKDRQNSTNSIPLIQTDAAINPGNSGGALLNMKGEVVGINSSKYASTDVEGMGYAIPISRVTDIIDEMMNGEVRDKVDASDMGYLGIECGTVTSDMITFYGAPAGVYVSRVLQGGGAEKAGIPEDSIITKLGGHTITSTSSITNVLQYYKVGEQVEVTYSVLEGNKYVEHTVTVTLGKKIVN